MRSIRIGFRQKALEGGFGELGKGQNHKHCSRRGQLLGKLRLGPSSCGLICWSIEK